MDADGTDQTRITNSVTHDGRPAWSPDGARIAFQRVCGTRCQDIWVMNADGSGQTNLTNDTAPNHPTNGNAVWSPDGTKIAFHRTHSDTNVEIYVMNPNGSGLTQLTSAGINYRSPDWSPDGAKIAFDCGPAGTADICVMNANGSGQTNLTNGSRGVTSDPVWSPDGTKIAFIADPGDVWVMNANGSSQTQLASSGAGSPDWQPLVYSFSGFFSPVDNPPVLNSVKAGAGVPVKFSLGGDRGLNVFATGYPRSQRINCDTSALLDTIEETVPAGSSSLSYDPVADQYVYVWKTEKAWAGTCRQLTVRLNNLTEHAANFRFK